MMRPSVEQASGLLANLVRHRNAANLFMFLLVIFGVWGVSQLNRQFLPTVDPRTITVSTNWQGASAQDIEKNIILLVEPAVGAVDGVARMSATVREGSGTIYLEFERTTDMSAAQSQVETAVRSVANLPEGVEALTVSFRRFFDPVADIGLAGPFPEQTLRRFARELRDGLLAAGLDQVEMTGYRGREFQVSVDEGRLRQLGLTLGDLSTKISQNLSDQPSGTLPGEFDAKIRALAAEISAEELRRTEISSLPTGETLTLGDVATVSDGFVKTESLGFMRGIPAVRLTVSRSADADTITSFEAITDYIEQVRPTLPATLRLQLINAGAEQVDARLGLLITNGALGLLVVLVVLFVFLGGRIGFWVALGIPVSILTTLGLMALTGQTLDMISMFALMMTLGIIVDDAIVVGEHTATLYSSGDSREVAAISGAGRMAAPVIAASLTTVAAFGPLWLIGDTVGQIMAALPLVVVAVLFASLLECFLILPSHLAHSLPQVRKTPGFFRRYFDRGFGLFRDRIVGPLADFSYRWRYATVAGIVAVTIAGLALVMSGQLRFQFFPAVEGEHVRVSAAFQPGIPQEQMVEIIGSIEATVSQVEEDLAAEGEQLIKTTFANLDLENGSVNLDVYLTPSEARSVRTNEISTAIESQVPRVAGLERLGVRQQRGGPQGRAIDVQFAGSDVGTLKLASEELQNVLAGFDGVSAIEDDLRYGDPELVMEMTDRGTSLGFTLEALGTQLRDSFEGRTVAQFPLDGEEVSFRLVRESVAEGSAAVRDLWIKAPDGRFVPVSEIVQFSQRQGFNRLNREGGRSLISVRADVDDEMADATGLIDRLEAEYLPEIVAKYGLTYKLGGRQAEREAAFADLQLGSVIAIAVMYIIMAWVFASYFIPLAVMLVIPFGIVGALWGHKLMGYDLTMVSLMGLLGLSGILVNDAIVLIARFQERRASGETMREATVGASRDRLRAVLLTSLTTIGGLAPLLFEKSLQAQFLIPMAITIVFGLGLATIQVLFIVPAFIGIGTDIGAFMRWLFLARSAPGFGEILAGKQHNEAPLAPAE